MQVLASGPAAWGLVDAAGRLRRESGPEPVRANVTALPPGVPTLLAPTAGHIAESVIVSAGDRWLASLRAAAPDVVVDAGRWEPSQRTAHRIAGADLVGLVCRPTVGGIEAARLALGPAAPRGPGPGRGDRGRAQALPARGDRRPSRRPPRRHARLGPPRRRRPVGRGSRRPLAPVGAGESAAATAAHLDDLAHRRPGPVPTRRSAHRRPRRPGAAATEAAPGTTATGARR